MKIWANTLVKNEERYIWFSVMSVIEHLDRILIWDTGSTDNTVQIINEIRKLYPDKIDFREFGEVDIRSFTKARQEMLAKTEADWFVIVDGDEVWWDSAISLLVETIRKNGNRVESIVNRYSNIIGDIYHYQEEVAGMYEIDGLRGHLNIRAVNRKIKGLHFDKPHGQLGLYDKGGVLIQNRPAKERKHLGLGYLHFTNVIRSSTRQNDLYVPKRDVKFKFDLGINFPHDFYYPEVFFRPKPDIVPSPWERRSKEYKLRSYIEWPLKLIKRRIFKYERTGY
ncbi:hypothetical protein A2686_03235 [Candidatus Woesebacteria bacterium RIFCSPHIGHO2_01_FULL_38_10]|uniref:Glycosyltransferase 2-like domain-containing protein n=1 Tax=Candidatus Woesebacteria bacterium RIFCSPLOWO2_01_FULL_39_10b TaxID=1802517 RepID=A0A1F8B5K1_9BACT|nr:MAG: hypothetical protein A2686_03235 [Candidatus Woesebacteria bacterium RIFCSPHIGHO2_01_FULL_38_10]OGM59277.1 MAG: hypothetical protein A2892_05440 [Candidatus Woesebacteria bacterium RIFCSPLOWO2_01_FULL_39_10b]